MKCRFSLFCLLLLLALPAGRVAAMGTIAFGSSVGARNLTSTDQPLNAGFQFEIGCFTPGFVPTRENTALWTSYWSAFPDGAAAYRTEPLGDPFPSTLRLNSFAGSVTLRNDPAFPAGRPFYIWGYNQRSVPGEAQWILVTDPTWICPGSQDLQPAISCSVADATIAIVGALNAEGVEMRTAAVTIPAPWQESLADWRVHEFGAAAADPALEATLWGSVADPDHDSLSNLAEYFLGTDPQAADEGPLTTPAADAGSLVFYYRRNALAYGVSGRVEWSTDLLQWSSEGVTEKVVAEKDSTSVLEVRVGFLGTGSGYFRLKIEE